MLVKRDERSVSTARYSVAEDGAHGFVAHEDEVHEDEVHEDVAHEDEVHEDEEHQARFVCVHFPQWPLDAMRVMLWRRLHRLIASTRPRKATGRTVPMRETALVAQDIHGRQAAGSVDPVRDASSRAGSLRARQVLALLDAWPSVLVEQGADHAGDHGGAGSRPDRSLRIVSCDRGAAALGMRVGMTIAQAETVCPRTRQEIGSALRGVASAMFGPYAGDDDPLHAGFVRGSIIDLLGRSCIDTDCGLLMYRADPKAWSAMLLRLAACLERWVPRVTLESPVPVASDAASLEALQDQRFGLLADMTGCNALFRSVHGTEQTLMRRLASSFGTRGFETGIATASTIGAAIALARHGGKSVLALAAQERESGRTRRMNGAPPLQTVRCRSMEAVPKGREAQWLEPLPIEALRLGRDIVAALHAVEVRTIGQLTRLDRAGIAARLSMPEAEALAPTADFAGAHGNERRSVGKRGTQRSRGRPAPRGSPSLFDGISGPVDGPPDACTTDSAALRRDGGQQEHGVGESTSILDVGGMLGGRDILVRIDQALGKAPERVMPLRMRDPVAFTKTFDGPTQRLEALFAACGELIDRMASDLETRREGMRVARWFFRHAELPADLSANAQAFPAATACTAADACDSPKAADARRRLSELELRLSSPSARRAHLWAMLRPKVERIPLDHGVEEISVHVEQSVRLRVRQHRLQLPRETCSVSQPTGKEAIARAMPRRSQRGRALASTAWSGIEDGDAGWLSASHVERLSDVTRAAGDAERLELPRRQEWLDLVVARFGHESMTHAPARPRTSGTGAGVDARGGPSGSGFGASDSRGNRTAHAGMPLGRDATPMGAFLGRRPTQCFVSEEHGLIEGHHASDLLAASIAWRTAWLHEAPDDPPNSDVAGPILSWRGRRWALSAIDGWERCAAPWWEGGNGSDHGGRVRSCATAASAVGHLSGRLHARIRIGSGLWLFVRFPESFAPLAHESDQIDPWLARCVASFQAGLPVAVLGAWG